MKRRADEGGVKRLLEELGIEESTDAQLFLCALSTPARRFTAERMRRFTSIS